MREYEISLWKDRIEIVADDEAQGGISTNTYEQKICTIGANNSTSPFYATNSIFTQKHSGEISLSFDMYSPIVDPYSGQKVENPYIGMLQMESKIKLTVDDSGPFYFILKTVTENSQQHKYSYSCIGLAQNELSKTGYSLNFDTELTNNIGTIDQLADEVLDGTEWTIQKNVSLQELKEEPLYVATLAEGIRVSQTPGEAEVSIDSSQKIYIFYSDYNSAEEPHGGYQFIWKKDDDFSVNDDGLILDTDCNYFFSNLDKNLNDYLQQIGKTGIFAQVSNSYRGKKKVYSPVTLYSPVLNRVVNEVAKKETKETKARARMYTEVEYVTSELVQNIISPSKDFTYTAGWFIENGELNLITYPDILDGFSLDQTYLSCIEAKPRSGQTYLYNTSINSYFQTTKDNYFVGEKWKVQIYDENGTLKASNPLIELIEYTDISNNDGIKVLGSNSGENQYVAATQQISTENKKYALRFTINSTFTFSEIKFYRSVFIDKVEQEPGATIEGKVKTKYYIYSPTNDIVGKAAEDLEYLYTGYDLGEYELVYDKEFTKKRSISGSKTNRLNLLQNIAEAFECWILFEIKPDEYGKLIKTVTFKEYNQVDNYAGFKYGINLQSIQRKVDSTSICTKLIVEDNVTDLAEGGFCSIAAATQNDLKENFLINFDYYISQGVLDPAVVNLDIYGPLGLYTKIRELNKTKDEESKELAALVGTTIPNLTASLTTFEELRNSAQLNFNEANQQLKEINGYVYEDYVAGRAQVKLDLEKQLLVKCQQYEQTLNSSKEAASNIQTQLTQAEERVDTLDQAIKDRADEIKKIVQDFEKKYSQYVQEGAWTSQDYIDNNLYYYDALSTLRTSSRPKITYTINVVDISKQEGYELYNFKPGDKTFIQDPDFFGEGYKEEVIVEEIKLSLDDESKNTISIKNYKTEFDDLFQRVNSIATQVQFSTGKYLQAASAFDQNGNIRYDILDNALASNDFVISNSSNNSVIWNSSGITTINLNNVNEMVGIVGGGIFLSKDGGNSWATGITGSGINANYITSGRLDTNLIQIMNGGFPSFKWDWDGLNAYEFQPEDGGSPTTYDPTRFIRFNRFGIFGSRSTEEGAYDSLEKIRENSAFSLTRKGLRYNDSLGQPTLQADNDGNLEIVGKIVIKNIGKDSDNVITIGPSDVPNAGGDDGRAAYAVFNANNKFYILDDGTVHAENGFFQGRVEATSGYFQGEVVATSGKFQGIVEATSGKIGNIQIENGGLYIPSSESGGSIEINTEGIVGTGADGEPFFLVTPDGNIKIKGSFTAENGTFIGEVTATSGEIGGFIIKDDRLVSKRVKDESLPEGEQEPLIQLMGADGKIVAENIELGVGAVITDRIEFNGKNDEQAFIFNPAKHDGTFIQTQGIKIDINGLAHFGNIKIDGIQSVISGKNWNITPEKASFEHIVAKGGTIENVVFENQSVQSVGGFMMFRPSLKANNISQNNEENYWILYFDQGSDYTSFLVNDYILLSAKNKNSYWQIIEINQQENTFKIKPNSQEDFNISLNEICEIVVTKLASVEEIGDEKSLTDQLLIGVNPHIFRRGEINKDLGALYREGITFIKPTLIERQEDDQTYYEFGYNNSTPDLFMGNLASIGKEGINWPEMSGYGLFANNVYLRGALITEADDSYAGVNTNSQACFNRSKDYESLEEDTSEIIFWAGAENLSSISSAPFQVTKNGTLYATQGLFEGSIISNSVIEASRIITAEIIGNGHEDNSNRPALLVTDATYGILFKTTEDEGGNNGFKVGYSVNKQYTLDLSKDELGIQLTSEGAINGYGGGVIQFSNDVTLNNNLAVTKSSIDLKNQAPLNLNRSSIYFEKGAAEILTSYDNNNNVVGYDVYIF